MLYLVLQINAFTVLRIHLSESKCLLKEKKNVTKFVYGCWRSCLHESREHHKCTDQISLEEIYLMIFHYFASYKFFDFYNYMWTKFQLHLKGFLQRVLAMTGFLHVHCIWTTISQNFSKYVFTPIECNKVFFCIFVQKIAGNNKSFIAPASKSRVLLMYVIFTDRVCQLCVHSTLVSWIMNSL